MTALLGFERLSVVTMGNIFCCPANSRLELGFVIRYAEPLRARPSARLTRSDGSGLP